MQSLALGVFFVTHGDVWKGVINPKNGTHTNVVLVAEEDCY
jgi:hypothetical protein